MLIQSRKEPVTLGQSLLNTSAEKGEHRSWGAVTPSALGAGGRGFESRLLYSLFSLFKFRNCDGYEQESWDHRWNDQSI